MMFRNLILLHLFYSSGINGENSERTIILNFPFISKISKGIIITDSNNAKDFIKRNIDFSTPLNFTLRPYGGFVNKTLTK
jgi:hypothetical protein